MTEVPTSIRLPKKLRDLLAEHAQKARRSLSAEIIVRLESTLEPGAVADLSERALPMDAGEHVPPQLDFGQE